MQLQVSSTARGLAMIASALLVTRQLINEDLTPRLR